jgi:tetratricopeptide (TPR) repeat protein
MFNFNYLFARFMKCYISVLPRHFSFTVRSLVLTFGFTLLFADVVFAQYREIDSLQDRLEAATQKESVDIYAELSRKFKNVDIDTALNYALKAEELASKIGYLEGLLVAYRRQNSVYGSKNEWPKSLAVDLKALKVAEELADKQTLARVKHQLAGTYNFLDMRVECIKQLLEALQIYQEIGNAEGVIEVYNTIGNFYRDTGERSKAIVYYKKVVEADANSWMANLTRINLASMYQKDKLFTLAISTLDSSLAYFEKDPSERPNHSSMIATIIARKGIIYREVGDLERAKTMLDRAIAIFQRMDNRQNTGICLLELGKSVTLQKNYSGASRYLNEAINYLNVNSHGKRAEAHACLAQIEYLQSNYEKAAQYQRTAQLYKDSIFANLNSEEYTNQKVQFEAKELLKKSENLKSESNVQIFTILLLVALGVSFFFIIRLVIQSQSVRLSSVVSSKKHLEKTLKDKSEKESVLKHQLDVKAKEMTSLALNMIQKREMFETLRTTLQKLSDTTNGELNSSIRKLISSIKLSDHLDKDWETFKMYFEQVNGGFFDNLQRKFPELNANDLKLCALFKLNLDTKQIASILDISPESTKVAKHRIRKKLKISGADNMQYFLNQMSNSSERLQPS